MRESFRRLFRQKAYGFNGLADSLQHPYVEPESCKRLFLKKIEYGFCLVLMGMENT